MMPIKAGANGNYSKEAQNYELIHLEIMDMWTCLLLCVEKQKNVLVRLFNFEIMKEPRVFEFHE